MNLSIRAYLILALTLGISVLLGIGYTLSYQDIHYEITEVYDAELSQAAQVLDSLLQLQAVAAPPADTEDKSASGNASPDDSNDHDLAHKYENKVAYKIWLNDGTELMGNDEDDSVSLSWQPVEGYSHEPKYPAWRTYTLHDEKMGIWIKVAQNQQIREDITFEINKHNLQPLLFIVPLCYLLIYLIVRRGLRPLRQITDELKQRGPDHLAPLDVSRPPKEVVPVVSSINSLMEALKRSLSQQQRFTSNAAHEMRTPLAGIRIQAQNLALDEPENLMIQQHIISGIDRLSHMVNQLLTLSRIEAGDKNPSQRRLIDLHSSINQLLQDQRRQIRSRRLKVELLPETPVQARVHAEMLSVLLRNLIDNALRYTFEGGTVRIAIEEQTPDLVIEISDTGPGLTDEQKAQVFDRFYRAAGQDSDGCGIGLSIVQEICERYGFQIELSDSTLGDSGLCIRLICPDALNAEAPE